jgi:hypothetical protein
MIAPLPYSTLNILYRFLGYNVTLEEYERGKFACYEVKKTFLNRSGSFPDANHISRR